MVVACPKCKAKLKVDDSKLSSGGSRFKCPKCAAVLVVRKPVSQPKKALDNRKVLVAHSNPEVRGMTASMIAGTGLQVITAADGIEAVVKALKENPFMSVIEVALPKIYGFEVCKRLKSRAETKDMKFILVSTVYDKAKYRREPVSLYGADDYIEEHDLSAQLLEKVERLAGQPEVRPGMQPEAREKEKIQEQPAQQKPAGPAQEPPPAPAAVKETAPAAADSADEEKIERARRLARTIIGDIYLYNSAKLDESIKNDNFYAAFASDLNEGKKLYESRIPQEIRGIKDFYKEAIDNFISGRKKIIS